MSIEAMKQALEALEGCEDVTADVLKAITAIKEALAQPEQEPVAYTGNGTAGREADVRPTGFFFQADKRQPEQKPVGEVYGWHGVGVGQPLCRFNVTESDMPVGSLLYTTPPQRTWVGLTKKEVHDLFHPDFEIFHQRIEAKLKEKNT